MLLLERIAVVITVLVSSDGSRRIYERRRRKAGAEFGDSVHRGDFRRASRAEGPRRRIRNGTTWSERSTFSKADETSCGRSRGQRRRGIERLADVDENMWRERQRERRRRRHGHYIQFMVPERAKGADEGGPGIDFFSGTVESVRRTLKRLSADADWPDRSARPGLLPASVCPPTGPPYTRLFHAFAHLYTLGYAHGRGRITITKSATTDGSRIEQVRKVFARTRQVSLARLSYVGERCFFLPVSLLSFSLLQYIHHCTSFYIVIL